MEKLCILLFISAYPFCVMSESFAEVESRENEIILKNEYPEKLEVTLLHESNEKVCKAVTKKSVCRKEEDISGDYSHICHTPLNLGKDCTSKNYFLAYLTTNSPVSFSIVPEKVLTEQEASTINLKASKSDIYINQYKKMEKCFKEDNDILRLSKLFGFQYIIEKNNILSIIGHKLSHLKTTGTLFALYNGNISIVSGDFSTEKPKVFILNNIAYILTAHSCPTGGCGFYEYQLYKIYNDNFKLLFSFGSYS